MGELANAYKYLISTHAPAGGATKNAAALASVCRISTHAPAGGATSAGTILFTVLAYFYSRPCGRGDAASRW